MKLKTTLAITLLLILPALAAQTTTTTANQTAAATPHGTSTIEMICFVVTILGIAALAYSYLLTQTQDGLEAQAANLKRLIEKQRAEIRENESLIAKQREDLGKTVDWRVAEEAAKAGKLSQAKRQQPADSLRMEYWKRLQDMSFEGGEVDKLEAQRKEMENIIELTKTKYHSRVIDEKTFGEIVGEYEKKLIELESKINKARGKTE